MCVKGYQLCVFHFNFTQYHFRYLEQVRVAQRHVLQELVKVFAWAYLNCPQGQSLIWLLRLRDKTIQH